MRLRIRDRTPERTARALRRMYALEAWHGRFAWWPTRVSPDEVVWLGRFEARREWRPSAVRWLWHVRPYGREDEDLEAGYSATPGRPPAELWFFLWCVAIGSCVAWAL